MASIFWWVVFPYIAGTVMIAGLLYSFVYRQKKWAAPSTEFFEKKWLRIGSPLFSLRHYLCLHRSCDGDGSAQEFL